MKDYNLVYPAIFYKEDDGEIYVDFPDFYEKMTYGKTMEEAYNNAVDVLSLITFEEQHPTPTKFAELKLKDGQIAMLVSADYKNIEDVNDTPNLAGAEVFNNALKENGLTKYKLAKMLEVSESQLSRIASGKRRPSPELAQRIAGILNISWEVFFKK